MLETSVEFRVDVYGDAASPYVGRRRYVPPPVSDQARAANLHVLAWACSKKGKKEESFPFPFPIHTLSNTMSILLPPPPFSVGLVASVPLKGGDF